LRLRRKYLPSSHSSLAAGSSASRYHVPRQPDRLDRFQDQVDRLAVVLSAGAKPPSVADAGVVAFGREHLRQRLVDLTPQRNPSAKLLAPSGMIMNS